MSAIEVLDAEAPERSLDELAATANREHIAAQNAAVSAVQHAIAAGQVLLEARNRCPARGWEDWVCRNLEMSPGTAGVYIRLAYFKEVVLASDVTGITEAKKLLTGLPSTALSPGAPRSLNDTERARAKQLLGDGMSPGAVGDILGVSRNTIRRLQDPDRTKRERERLAAFKKRRAAEQRALRNQLKEQTISRAVRKAGAATQEAWSMAERFQDVIAQAQRETEDREARAALSRAGEHHRKMRDEIVKALGVG
jgi:transposase